MAMRGLEKLFTKPSNLDSTKKNGSIPMDSNPIESTHTPSGGGLHEKNHDSWTYLISGPVLCPDSSNNNARAYSSRITFSPPSSTVSVIPKKSVVVVPLNYPRHCSEWASVKQLLKKVISKSMAMQNGWCHPYYREVVRNA